ncbi:MAG: hypothetical protein LBV41_05225 [Cytophagaceae bacterium]|jgi:hypothetical protein|nr:hypothetical protein [Cytophagaceae bacterium]
MKDALTYSKIEIEIADYILANPSEKFAKTVRKFAKICERPEATVKRYYYNAKRLAKERIQRQEETKDKVLTSAAKTSAENALKSREFYLWELEKDFVRLGEIKSGDVFKDVDKKTGKIIGFRQAGYNDEIQAKRSRVAIAQRVAELNGWDAPTKNEVTGRGGKDLFTNLTDDELDMRIVELERKLGK